MRTAGPQTAPAPRSRIITAISSAACIGGPDPEEQDILLRHLRIHASKSPSSQTATFPTLDQRNGDFSKTYFSDGQLITIYNPFDTYRDAERRHQAQSLPGKHHPARTMMDPVALKAMQYYPLPNQDPNPITHVNNFFPQGIGESTAKPQFDIKGDHSFTDRFRVHGPLQRQLEQRAPASTCSA